VEPPFTWWADFDRSGLVDFGDFNFFAANFGKQKPDSSIVFPPNFPQAWQSPPQAMRRAEALGRASTNTQIDVELVALTNPSNSDQLSQLPVSVTQVAPGSTYYVEVWVQDVLEPGVGVTGGYVDITYTTDVADGGALNHGGVFNLLTSGAVDDTAGRVDDFGGGTMDGSVGVKPNWARLGYVAFQGTAQGPVTFNVQPGSLQFSRFGAGNVPWSEVDFDTLTLEQRTPVPEISVADTRLTEGTDGMTNAVFAVILSAGSTETVTVRYATADGTAMERRRDYISRSGSLTFKPGETSKAIQIAVIGDEIHEADQTFYVNLTDATNATISDGQGLGTILDDESDSRTLRNRDVQDYEDADNDWFRLEYRGSGEAEVAFADDGQYGADIAAIAFTGATSGTKLTSTLVEPGKDGQGRTTIESIEAVGQSLGTLDFSLETRGAAIQNQTSLMGSVEIGGRMSKFAFGGDVLGDVQIGGPVTNVIIGGALDGQFSAVGTITKAVAGSLGENARLSSAEGSILALTT
ncbi:MAG: hypothetical protein FJ290_33655, partial [Planctomycetes bacterium]|nr:hypothetical protein [Planctomycetota bacterium]